MKKYVLQISYVLFILLFQVLFDSYLTIKGLIPDFLLIFILTYALFQPLRESILISSIAGLGEDLFSGGVLGLFLLPRVIASYVVSLLKESPIKSYLKLVLPIIIFIGSLFTYEIEFVFANILKIGAYSHLDILKVSFINFLFTPVSYIFIYLIKKSEGEK